MRPSFHGLLLVNKMAGDGTSHDMVARARRILGTKNVGHAGTLDPLAGGLMVLLVGEGTKLSPYLLEGNKSYRAKAKLGLRTDTLDITGQMVCEAPVVATEAEIKAVAFAQEGEFRWPVPIYSAAKIKGQPLYQYARQGVEVEIPQKVMKFWDIQFESYEAGELAVHLHCSKGSFIRTWVDQLGQNLGCFAAMSALTRTGSEPFSLSAAATLEEVEDNWNGSGDLGTCFVPMAEALPQVQKITVRGMDQALLKNGQISHDLRALLLTYLRPPSFEGQLVQILNSERELLALIGLEPGKGFAIRRVFKPS